VNEPTRKIPAIAEKIKKLQARSDAIRRRLQVPCPTKYGNKEAANDCVRLMLWRPDSSVLKLQGHNRGIGESSVMDTTSPLTAR
jgi:hypothetical protein